MRTLEGTGLIRGYHAEVNAREPGFEVQVFINAGPDSQAEAERRAFEGRCRNWPLVRECHMLNGEVDFILMRGPRSPGLSELSDRRMAMPNVASVRTSLVIRDARPEPGVPFDVLEDRLARDA